MGANIGLRRRGRAATLLFVADISPARGSILEGPFWPEPVRVLAVERKGKRIHLKAVGTRTDRYYPVVLDDTEFAAKVRVRPDRTTPTFSAPALPFRLAIEAERVRPEF